MITKLSPLNYITKLLHKNQMFLIAGFGNPLLDVTVRIHDDELLQKYGLLEDDQQETTASVIKSMFKDIEKYPQTKSLGGCVQNTLRVVQWLLQQPSATVFFGGIGNDEQSIILKKMLRSSGVTAKFITNETKMTGTCIAFVKQPNRALVAHVGAAETYTLDAAKDTLNILSTVQIVYMEGFFLTKRIDAAHFIHEYSTDKSIFVYNLGGVYLCDLLPDSVVHFAKGSHIVFGNIGEYMALGQLLKLDKIHDIVLFLNKSHVSNARLRFGKIVIVTNGHNDILCAFNNGQLLNIPVHFISPDKIEDTTGAGDSFVAGFLVGYLRGYSLEICIQLGCWTSSQIIQQIGCTIPDFIPDLKCIIDTFQ